MSDMMLFAECKYVDATSCNAAMTKGFYPTFYWMGVQFIVDRWSATRPKKTVKVGFWDDLFEKEILDKDEDHMRVTLNRSDRCFAYEATEFRLKHGTII